MTDRYQLIYWWPELCRLAASFCRPSRVELAILSRVSVDSITCHEFR